MTKNLKLLAFTAVLVVGLGVGYYFLTNTDDEITVDEVTLAHDKGNLPVFQRNFERQGQKAKEKTGIGIKPIPSQTADLYIHQMKASLPTEQAPDLFIWWSTYRVKELVDQNLVGDLTELWDKHRAEYSQGIRDAFTINGKLYGFPYVVEYWPVWYNKKVFKRLGLKEPETWEQFIQICDSLKAAGITPILSSLQNRWPSFIWFEEMIIGEDPDLYKELCEGKIKYSHPKVRKAFLVWKEMIEKAYFTDPSANMLTNAGYLWNNKKFGMVLAGSWYHAAVLIDQGVDENEIGAFILPSHNPAAGKNVIFEVGPIFTAKKSKNQKATTVVADWWMGSEGSEHFARMHKAFPGNLNAKSDYLQPVKVKLLNTIKSENYQVLNRYWEATPAEISGAAVDKFAEFILNPNDLENVLKGLDEIADQYWSQNGKGKD